MLQSIYFQGGIVKNVFRYSLMGVAAWMVVSCPVYGQAKLENPLVINTATREAMRNYVDRNRSKKESEDAWEIFAAMDYAIRHEPFPQGLLERMVTRANSAKMGGFIDKETLKTYGSGLATDFYYHEQRHVEHEAEQDRLIDQLRKDVEELKKQIAP